MSHHESAHCWMMWLERNFLGIGNSERVIINKFSINIYGFYFTWLAPKLCCCLLFCCWYCWFCWNGWFFSWWGLDWKLMQNVFHSFINTLIYFWMYLKIVNKQTVDPFTIKNTIRTFKENDDRTIFFFLLFILFPLFSFAFFRRIFINNLFNHIFKMNMKLFNKYIFFINIFLGCAVCVFLPDAIVIIKWIV